MSAYTDRRAYEELIFRVGEKRRISHFISADPEPATATVTATIYAPSGTAVVTAAVGFFSATATPNENEVGYLWDTTGVAPGDYTYQLRVTVEDEIIVLAGEVHVIKLVSQLDDWIARIRRWTMETGVGETQRQLSLQHYRDVATAAVREFERIHPLPQYLPVALTTGVFEYALPAAYSVGFSAIERIEYPVDDTVQDQTFLLQEEFVVDDDRGFWRFTWTSPQTGQTARVYYTTRHILTDNTDTVPTEWFDSVTQFAAGLALVNLGSKAAGTSSPIQGAEMVQYRTKQQEYRQQGLELIRLARETWGPGQTGVTGVMSYLPYHGRLIYLQQ